MDTSDVAFPGYVVQTKRAGPPFYAFVLVYTAFAFFLIAPLVSWSRVYEKQDEEQEVPESAGDERDSQPGGQQQPTHPMKQKAKSESPLIGKENAPKKATSSVTSKKTASVVSGARSGFGLLLRELDKVAAAEYPNFEPRVGSGTPTEHSTGVPSAATTSRIHVAPSSKKMSSLVLDVGGRRWKQRRPIGRADVIQRAIHTETGSLVSRAGAARKKRIAKGMSDVASSVLEEQSQQADSMVFNRATQTYRNRFARSRAGSFSVRSERSAMSSIVDDISPNDAADANDPGRGNIFQPSSRDADKEVALHSGLGCVSSLLEGLLQMAAPGDDIKRVASSSILLSIGAMSESLFRLIIAAFISHYLGTESMISYLLVGLFVRLTSEQIAGAVVDSVSSFLQVCLFSGDDDAAFVAGQYIQLAVVLQLLLGIPLLALWYLYMDSVVYWLVASNSISSIALEYARVVVFNFLLQAVAQTVGVVFHICGHEHFESIIDFAASTVQLVVVASVVAMVENVSLTTVGYIQLMFGVATSLTKILFPIQRGWMKQFGRGIVGNCALVANQSGFWQLSRATFPLLVGSFLEYGEWEVLTLCLKHLGPAEVATWALLGAFWDVLEAFTEGIGEAASIQVAFLLAAGQPRRAAKMSNSAIYLAVVQSILITSGLFMGGRSLAVLFSSDSTLQHMTNEAISLIGLANISMGCAQISWSLIGAQGRFRLATSVVFFARWIVTMPMSLICIFVFFLDLNAVAGSLIVGYSTAACALTFIVLRSDWDLLARAMQEMNCPPSMDESDFFDDEDSSSEDDDSAF